MKLRSRTEIICEILEAAKDGTIKTKIMYKAFLTYNQLKEYLSELIKNKLLEYSDDTQTYKTTEKGLNFLTMYIEIGEAFQNITHNKLV